MVLYVDDILLATNDIGMLHETKRFLSKKFEMKDLGDASFVLGIQIHRDHSRVYLVYHKRVILIKFLKGLACMIAHQRYRHVIITQIMLFCTLVITSFEQSLHNNHLNYPDWHVKVLAILLIAFCGKFCSFYELVMPKLPRQINHQESKLNSEL